jgi:hypothetical protein
MDYSERIIREDVHAEAQREEMKKGDKVSAWANVKGATDPKDTKRCTFDPDSRRTACYVCKGHAASKSLNFTGYVE